MSVIFGVITLGVGTAFCLDKEENKENVRDGEVFGNTVPSKKENICKNMVNSRPLEDIFYDKNWQITNGNNDESQMEFLDNKSPLKLDEAARRAQMLLSRHMVQTGAPGLVAAVSVNGKTVWAHGFGYADVENSIHCHSHTVMRIASISKSLTMTAVAKLWEEGKLDLDAPIQKYMPYFPIKTFEGKEVTITTRHLLSHQSGIRHYKLRDTKKNNKFKKIEQNADNNSNLKMTKEDDRKEEKGKRMARDDSYTNEQQCLPSLDSSKNDQKETQHSLLSSPEKKKHTAQKLLMGKTSSNKMKKKGEDDDDEFDLKEYYIKEKFDTIQEAVKLFQDDELFFKPGEGFLYTTHGWTLVSGVVEGAANKPFTDVITNLFHDLGLNETFLDKHDPVIMNRARCYIRNKHWKLKNAPYVDNSYKWAGGGFLSTVHDLIRFGNAMLYASQQDESNAGTNILPGYLKASTMHDLWTPINGTNMGWDKDGGYGLGWGSVVEKQEYGYCRATRRYASHTGGAVGASSVLLILPNKGEKEGNSKGLIPPEGVVVALITNMQGVGLNRVALQIAKLFESTE
ncbi:hypothetical protein SK128_004510 [Halocaridina rubra]|uniref:Beta-lactamase-related domain-containing protein n=1 Tax=Halocaridina rubra TaxID=373956 RepID=A0AAN8WDZ0_HALRR